MKKLDKLIISSFLGPFFLTFVVVVFILLTVHMLKYFDDIVGKGLEWYVIGKLLFFFAIFVTPNAIHLAILLSSLMTFGNLGEHFELTAIKSSGISLLRALRPIFVFVLLMTVFAFYSNNYFVPKAALNAYSLMYDIKQKKPALNLKEGAFYDGIPNFSIKVNEKFSDGQTIKDVIIYNHKDKDGNKDVTIADSGRMYTFMDDKYLKFELFNGRSYKEGEGSSSRTYRRSDKPESLSRYKFKESKFVMDLSSFDIKETKKELFSRNRIMRNLSELEVDSDSIRNEVWDERLNHVKNFKFFFGKYDFKEEPLPIPLELARYQVRRDSLDSVKNVLAEIKRKKAEEERKKEEKRLEEEEKKRQKEEAEKSRARKDSINAAMKAARKKNAISKPLDIASKKKQKMVSPQVNNATNKEKSPARKYETASDRPNVSKEVIKDFNKKEKRKKSVQAKDKEKPALTPKKRSKKKGIPGKQKEQVKIVKKNETTAGKVAAADEPLALVEVENDTIIAEKIVEKDSAAIADSIALAQRTPEEVLEDFIQQGNTNSKVLSSSLNKVRQVKSKLSGHNKRMKDIRREFYIVSIQWHKILGNCAACIIMFLIGAPLGAIIKRGGLGMPVLISIVFFIIYYVINMTGEKWAKQGAIDAVWGMWAANALLLPIGIFFLRQARNDARLFDADFYSVVIEKVKVFVGKRKKVKNLTVDNK